MNTRYLQCTPGRTDSDDYYYYTFPGPFGVTTVIDLPGYHSRERLHLKLLGEWGVGSVWPVSCKGRTFQRGAEFCSWTVLGIQGTTMCIQRCTQSRRCIEKRASTHRHQRQLLALAARRQLRGRYSRRRPPVRS